MTCWGSLRTGVGDPCRRRHIPILSRCCSWEALKNTFPFLWWLPQYSIQWLQLDIIAGFTVGLTVVPQALAYAEVAGLPVEFGLYSSYIGCFIYCLFGTSKDVTLGPTAIMSLLVSVYTSGDASLAILLAFLSGCIQLAMGLLKFGLKDIPRQFILQVYETFHKLPSVRLGDAALGFLCIAFLMSLKFMKEHFPRVYRGMPRCYRLCYIIVWVTTTASQNNYRINTNQELLAIGLTNFLGSFLSAYPVTGSFGRTALNSQTGVCTPAGGILTGLLVLFSLGYLTPLFFYIPKAALAAVIICAVAPMFDLGICKTLWKVKKMDLLPFLVTFLLSFWEIQYGILAGILVSLIILCFTIARPKVKVIDPNGVTLMVMSGLSFPAVEYLRDAVSEIAFADSWPQPVVLDFTHVNVLDYTVVMGLRELQHDFQSQGRSLLFSGLQVFVVRWNNSSYLIGSFQFV
ncbi:hypothetical protein GDO78_004092 [Eleutherodactylus coqui]|uniref:STAS domain-containing protein n=1 Tax=Eleutherodactylus coqui TaxID=57060 RepID=A0A8J6ERP8_ELECQ|nr:hypothetical protein GDO78_004092 [Eleutherodactylus coqui]